MGWAPKLPLSRQTRTHSTTVLIATSNSDAVCRRDKPPSTVLTTRSRKSREYGRAIHAGPLPSMQLESQLAVQGNPLFRFLQPGYPSSSVGSRRVESFDVDLFGSLPHRVAVVPGLHA